MKAKRLLTALALMVLTIAVWAVPARPGVTKTVLDVNGKEITIMLHGDETFHFYTATDGTPMKKRADGRWEADTRDVNELWRKAMKERNFQRLQMAEHVHKAMKAPKRVGVSTETSGGTKKGLLILVNFKDVKMKSSSTKTVFNRMLNGLNNPYGKNHGSVREYFRDQSYGEFDVEFDIVGPVTVSQNMEHYGANKDGVEGVDSHPEEMISEACKLVDNQVNFADYDWDGDGTVENIYVTYAGYAESNGASENTIWPHQWDLFSAYYYNNNNSNYSLRLDGVYINTYACGSELSGTSGSTISGIGTMCHEYSHCLGLPDFYVTSDGTHPDMLGWSLMASGSYNGEDNNGYCPAGYTSYERWFSGWLTPKELNTGYTVTNMKPIEDEPEAYIIYNDKNRNEYYLLANHQQKGWDTSAAGHGMMILHVDYDLTAWVENTVNNTNGHQRMIVIPAGGSFYSQYYQGRTYYYATDSDLWPGSTGNTKLTDTSTPKALLYNANTDGKKFMHKPIEEITEKNGLISFVFMGGTVIEAPVLAEATHVGPNSFQTSWNSVEGAVSYNLQLTEKVEAEQESNAVLDALTMLEYFDNFRATSDGTSDISSKLDSYTDIAGWTGSKVYQGKNGAKLGTSSAVGYMTTPVMDSNTSGYVTIYVEASSWGSDASTLRIYLQDASGNDLFANPWELDLSQYGGGTFGVRGTLPSHKIKFSTTAGGKRLYLEKVLIFDGQVSYDDINALEKPTPTPEDKITIITGITDTQYTFSGLTPETKYIVEVQAVNSDGGTSVWSNEISVTTPLFAKGDINGDGQVAIGDVTLLVNIILGKSTDASGRADVNGDGQINISDVTALVNLILGK